MERTEAPLAESWLWRRSKLPRVWRRRKVVLYPGQLSLYREAALPHRAPVLTATYALSSECRVEPCAEAYRFLHMFVVSGPRIGQVVLAAESAGDAAFWVGLLGSCCRTEVIEQPSPSTSPATRAAVLHGELSDSFALWPSAIDALQASTPATNVLQASKRLLHHTAIKELRQWPHLYTAVLAAVEQSMEHSDLSLIHI